MKQILLNILAVGIVLSAAISCQERSHGDELSDTTQAEFAKLTEKFNADMDLILKVGQLKEGEDVDLEDPAMSMADDFLDLESRERGSKVGFSCLYHLVMQAGRYSQHELKVTKAKRKALKILGEHYADYPDVDVIFRHVRAGARVPEPVEFLRAVIQRTKLDYVRANAKLELANVLATEASYPAISESRISLLNESSPDYLREMYLDFANQITDIDSDDFRREAVELLESLSALHGEELIPPFADPKTPSLIQINRAEVDELTKAKRLRIGEAIPGIKFQLKHNIGQRAPDIDKQDVEGNQMRLSDFYGRVVVLMFSYTGCGPCERMYPDNRKLVAELKSQPFSFVSVMRDKERHSILESFESKKITWRVWWDEGEALTKQWNVRHWPDIYVIDHSGVVRFRGLRGENLAIAVKKLLGEAAAPTSDK